jgi:hypothetical protein
VISITAMYNYQKYLSTRPELSEKNWGACAVYSVFKKLENGEFVHVASRNDLGTDRREGRQPIGST